MKKSGFGGTSWAKPAIFHQSLFSATPLLADRPKVGPSSRGIKRRLHAEAAPRRATITAYRRNLLFL
jgi:hypothetical protein